MTREEFTHLMIASGPRMLLAAMKIGLDKEDASDAVQDAMCRLWSHPEWYSRAENKEAYAVQTAANCARILIGRRRPVTEIREYDRVDHSAYSTIESRDRLRKVMEIIGSLPDLQRKSITLRDIEGLEFNEIASQLHVTEGNVRVLLSRARKTIKQFFSKEL